MFQKNLVNKKDLVEDIRPSGGDNFVNLRINKFHYLLSIFSPACKLKLCSMHIMEVAEFQNLYISVYSTELIGTTFNGKNIHSTTPHGAGHFFTL